jgi:hypothetical protein
MAGAYVEWGTEGSAGGGKKRINGERGGDIHTIYRGEKRVGLLL